MIPVTLTIEGLYSYQARQTINFSELTENGLFGIFGAVGSGKSSILEAITFALYGKTERLNESGDARNYNMMNLRSNRSYIDFEFLNYEQKRYRVTRSYRRNSKKYDDVKPGEALLYLWENNGWTPQQSNDVSDIIGLSYANFKRTIIIPQGQFKEFLELGATERTKMLKDIFNLQRFDLQSKAAALYAADKSDLDQLAGQLKAYETVTEEGILEIKAQLEQETEVFKSKEAEYKQETAAFELLKNVRSDLESLQEKEERLAALEKQKAVKEEEEMLLSVYEKARSAFATLLVQLQRTQDDLQRRSDEAVRERAILQQLRENAEDIKAKLAVAKAEYDLLPERRAEEMDLELICHNLKLLADVRAIAERQTKGKEFVRTAQEKAQATAQKQEDIKRGLLALKAARPDATVLFELEQWFAQNRLLQQQHAGLLKQMEDLDQEIGAHQNDLQRKDVNADTFEADHQLKLSQAEAAIEALRRELSKLELQQQLSGYVHTLHDGAACPLCGALEHPRILEVADVSKDIEDSNNSIRLESAAVREMNERRSLVQRTMMLLAGAIKQKEQVSAQLDKIRTQQQEHSKHFNWNGFTPGDEEQFQHQKEYLRTIESEIRTAEGLLETLQQAWQQEQEHLEKANRRMEDLRLEMAQKEAQLQQNINLLKHLRWDDHKAEALPAMSGRLETLKVAIRRTESDHQKYSGEWANIDPLIARQESKLATIQDLETALRHSLDEQDNAIVQCLRDNGFESLQQVRQILDMNLDVPVLRAALEVFKVNYKTLQNGVTELKQKLHGRTYDATDLLAQEVKVADMERELKLLSDKTAQLRSTLQRADQEWEQKKALMAMFAQLHTRTEHLSTLKKLFDRAGFVEYVSGIYLRQLCDMANVRFHRLTRNQLSLQMNSNNDFEIIDHLNEGKTRSVKTLSGGQAFQVSLSLALALADSVQANAKADKNFFFIDEGFGTQDAASVNIVFETLMNLRKENRIVGIISHVDELKEKIPMSLSVHKDETLGSLIRKSWS